MGESRGSTTSSAPVHTPRRRERHEDINVQDIWQEECQSLLRRRWDSRCKHEQGGWHIAGYNTFE